MDFESSSNWMPTVSAASWELQGAPDTGVGGIRLVRIGLTATHDRIVEGTRPHHHAYEVTLPWYSPLKDYRGDVRIGDRASGCLIVWTATRMSRIPGLGKIGAVQASRNTYASSGGARRRGRTLGAIDTDHFRAASARRFAPLVCEIVAHALAYALVDVPARDGFPGCAISQIAARTGTMTYGPSRGRTSARINSTGTWQRKGRRHDEQVGSQATHGVP
jgi:hypothetical protein